MVFIPLTRHHLAVLLFLDGFLSVFGDFYLRLKFLFGEEMGEWAIFLLF